MFSVEHTAALAWIDLIVLSDRVRVEIGRVAISLRLVLVVLLHKRFAVTVIFERGIALQQVGSGLFDAQSGHDVVHFWDGGVEQLGHALNRGPFSSA